MSLPTDPQEFARAQLKTTFPVVWLCFPGQFPDADAAAATPSPGSAYRLSRQLSSRKTSLSVPFIAGSKRTIRSSDTGSDARTRSRLTDLVWWLSCLCNPFPTLLGPARRLHALALPAPIDLDLLLRPATPTHPPSQHQQNGWFFHFITEHRHGEVIGSVACRRCVASPSGRSATGRPGVLVAAAEAIGSTRCHSARLRCPEALCVAWEVNGGVAGRVV